MLRDEPTLNRRVADVQFIGIIQRGNLRPIGQSMCADALSGECIGEGGLPPQTFGQHNGVNIVLSVVLYSGLQTCKRLLILRSDRHAHLRHGANVLCKCCGCTIVLITLAQRQLRKRLHRLEPLRFALEQALWRQNRRGDVTFQKIIARLCVAPKLLNRLRRITMQHQR